MKKIQTETNAGDAAKVTALVTKLNRYRHEYYNLAAPSVPDAVYDHLFDELQELEKQTGIILSNSPTQTVGAVPVSSLKKVKHPIPLLSLDKTKQMEELLAMAGRSAPLLMLKLDGLTVKICYENGRLVEASTRGDGETGELVTHNIPAFDNVPISIPHKGRLVVTGEGIIHQDDFEKIKGEVSDGRKEACNARNLAAGSIRLLYPAACRKRHIHFYAFNMIEGMEGFGKIADNRGKLLEALRSLGFEVCPFLPLTTKVSMEELEKGIRDLRDTAEDKGLPIDGMVLRYDSLSYSRGCGRTGHHYKDGIAYKFEDEVQETVFRSVEWTPGRSGEIAPVAVFDAVEIDGCRVSRASLHNISFIKDLELHPGCRILVSKRNMIIPHIEDNLDRGHYEKGMILGKCPCCGKPVRIYARKGIGGRIVETLHCDNQDCRNQLLRKLVHFAGKKAMDISGISEAVIDRFIEKGFLHTCQDFYYLDRYREEIIRMEGFGEKSYEQMQESIEKSRHTTFVRYVVAMGIPLIGRTAGRALDSFFKGNLQEFAKAAVNCFDFTSLPEFGEKMSRSIWEWFHKGDNLKLWKTLQKEFHFEEREGARSPVDFGSAPTGTERRKTMKKITENNPFAGCTVVATGKLAHFTRDGINSRITSLGATAGSSVTRKTDYLICGEKPGSKLAKAREMGIPVLTEQEFLDMIPA